MALRVDLEWTSACTGLALGQGEVPGGTGQGQIDPRSLDFNLGEVGYNIKPACFHTAVKKDTDYSAS